MNFLGAVSVKSLRRTFRQLLGCATLAVGLIGFGPSALGQSNSCSNPTPITGEGVWPFDNWCCPNGYWSVLGCGGFDDTAAFFEWTAPTSGNYVIYTSGDRASSFAVSTESDCSIAYQFVIGCRFDNDAPIFLPGATAGDSYLIEVTTHTTYGSRMLNIDKLTCDAGSFIDDGFEENDSLASAAVVSEGVYSDLAVRFDDPDYYQLMIPAGEELRVQTVNAHSDVQITLYDDQGQAMDSRNQGRIAIYAPGANTSRRARIKVNIPSNAAFENCSSYDLHIATHPILQSIETFCDPATPNSTGTSTTLHVFENLFYWGPVNPLIISASSGPPGQFGYIVAGSQVQQLGLPMGAQSICIGGNIGRYNEATSPLNSIGIFDSHGSWTSFDNEGLFLVVAMGYRTGYSVPEQLPNTLGPLMVGQSWGFQLWHRETGGGSATSNGVLLNW